MKITTYEAVTKEVDLPKYLKLKGSPWFYMILDDNTLISLRDYSDELSATLGLYPEIRRENISNNISLITKYGFDHISEAEFKNVFLKVSLELEKLAN